MFLVRTLMIDNSTLEKYYINIGRKLRLLQYRKNVVEYKRCNLYVQKLKAVKVCLSYKIALRLLNYIES
jgi:hypothetical protein